MMGSLSPEFAKEILETKVSPDFVAEFITESNLIENLPCKGHQVRSTIELYLNGEDISASWGKNLPHITGHIDAFYSMVKFRNNPADIFNIKVLHYKLMGDFRDFEERYLGEFRDCRVRVGHHIPPAPEHLERHLLRWEQMFIREPKKFSHEQAAWYRHAEFEYIHPFIDGNGRTGRLLMLWDILHRGLTLNESHIVKFGQREKYYNSLQKYEQEERPSVMTEDWDL